jgi:CheY-like chemotaxis protein
LTATVTGFTLVTMARKIAMIDDSQVELKWLTRHLARFGYEVVTHDLSIGIQAFVAQQQPDIVLMDVNMPALSDPLIFHMRSGA